MGAGSEIGRQMQSDMTGQGSRSQEILNGLFSLQFSLAKRIESWWCDVVAVFEIDLRMGSEPVCDDRCFFFFPVWHPTAEASIMRGVV